MATFVNKKEMQNFMNSVTIHTVDTYINLFGNGYVYFYSQLALSSNPM